MCDDSMDRIAGNILRGSRERRTAGKRAGRSTVRRSIKGDHFKSGLEQAGNQSEKLSSSPTPTVNQQDPPVRFAPAISCHFLYVIFCPGNNLEPGHLRPLKDRLLTFQISQRRRRAQKFLKSEGSIHRVAGFQR